MRGNGLVIGKKRQLGLLLSLDIEHFDALEPGLFLRVIDFAQIKNMTLDSAASGTTPASSVRRR